MENYQVIYNYLQTMPTETTVGTLLENLDKANEEFVKNHQKRLKLMKEEFINHTYYYEENDDDKVVCKYITYVNGFRDASFSDFTFDCEIIAMTTNEIKYDKNARIDIRALRMATQVDNDVFENAKQKVEALISISPVNKMNQEKPDDNN